KPSCLAWNLQFQPDFLAQISDETHRTDIIDKPDGYRDNQELSLKNGESQIPFSLQGNFGYDIMINRPNKLACDEITRSGAEVS
ncbi:MAG: hypothetical protein Q4D32_07955, partial [Eubacteriales bacterium]|nr:hypothetical protein [Eubacteriales bacterium]